MQTTAGANYQALATEFRPGDVVVPYGANRDYAGRVVSVWPAIGMVDVEFPNGTKRYPVEDILRLDNLGNPNPPHDGYVPGGAGTVSVPGGPLPMKHVAAVAEDKYEAAALLDVLANHLDDVGRELNRRDLSKSQGVGNDVSNLLDHVHLLWKRISWSISWLPTTVVRPKSPISFPKASASVSDLLLNLVATTTALRSAGDQIGFASNITALLDRVEKEAQAIEVRLRLARVATTHAKQALYWAERDRRYRTTAEEAASGKYGCPKCKKAQLRKAIYRRIKGQSEHLLGCPTCLFLIARDALVGMEA